MVYRLTKVYWNGARRVEKVSFGTQQQRSDYEARVLVQDPRVKWWAIEPIKEGS